MIVLLNQINFSQIILYLQTTPWEKKNLVSYETNSILGFDFSVNWRLELLSFDICTIWKNNNIIIILRTSASAATRNSIDG